MSVRVENLVTGPGLQIGEKRRGPGTAYGPRAGQPQERSACDLDLGHEEIVVGGQAERCHESHVELYFRAGYGAVAAIPAGYNLINELQVDFKLNRDDL